VHYTPAYKFIHKHALSKRNTSNNKFVGLQFCYRKIDFMGSTQNYYYFTLQGITAVRDLIQFKESMPEHDRAKS